MKAFSDGDFSLLRKAEATWYTKWASLLPTRRPTSFRPRLFIISATIPIALSLFWMMIILPEQVRLHASCGLSPWTIPNPHFFTYFALAMVTVEDSLNLNPLVALMLSPLLALLAVLQIRRIIMRYEAANQLPMAMIVIYGFWFGFVAMASCTMPMICFGTHK